MISNHENLLVDLMNEQASAVNKAMDNCLPCVITEVISRKEVTVRPMIKLVDKSGNTIDRAVIEGVPVYSSGAGNILISVPLAVGDLGWLHASDRDISLFLQSHEDSEPPTARMHNFSDAYFEPDIMYNFEVAEEDAAAIVIQNRTGTVKISIDGDRIKMANDDVSIVIDKTSVTGVASGGFDLNGFIIKADGAAESPVSLTSPSMVVSGKELKEHTHFGSPSAPVGPITPTGTITPIPPTGTV